MLAFVLSRAPAPKRAMELRMTETPPDLDLIVVRAAYDPDARVWYVESSEPLHGLNLEAETIEQLRDKIPAAVADLYQEAPRFVGKVAVEIIARTSTTVRIPAAA